MSDFRWTARLFQLLRPIVGFRLAGWIADYLPAAALAMIPMLLLWLFLSLYGSSSGTSVTHECGSGPYKWDCR